MPRLSTLDKTRNRILKEMAERAENAKRPTADEICEAREIRDPRYRRAFTSAKE